MATVRYLLPALAGIFCSVTLGAQTPGGTIAGRVIDSSTRQPLSGVAVFVEGTQRGTVTASDGTYRLSGVPEGARAIRARRIGYQPELRNITVGSGATATVDFALVSSPSFLNEVVVVGYQSQRKSDITGAVSTVAVADLESRRVADVAQVLQGQVAGVQITQSTGAPGEDISIRIRGEGTIGNNSPLFIVDGVPTRDISFLNPADMEALGYYGLDANYFDNFSVASEFAESETVFAYDHRSGANPRNGNGISAPLDWGFIAPTASFIAEFEANDPRLLYTVRVSDKAVYKLLGTTNKQYIGNDDAPGNKIYIRFADVLLWKAEAYNELGNASQAIAIINRIRQRARNGMSISGTPNPDGTLPDRNVAVTDKAQIKAWLIHERRVELGFESQRFNDLKRWGIAKQVLTALGKNFQDRSYLYPIPQGEIDKSGGSITQNPGY